jgi:hypothetical protein
MYPIQPTNLPADSGSYVPYFYQRGLHYLYSIAGAEGSRKPYDPAPSRYDFSQMHGPFHGVSAESQTVEQIIQHGYFAVPAGDPVTAIITDKQHTSRLGLDDVISQVRDRYEIYERNFYQIQLAKCAAMNAIYQAEAYRGAASVSARQHYAKHKAIQGLYEQEREERVNLWKDVSRLKLGLPESAQQYLSAHRKVLTLRGESP